jgi:hypothetical protein
MKNFFSAIMLALAATPALAYNLFYCDPNHPMGNLEHESVCHDKGVGTWLRSVCSARDQGSLLL